LISGNHDIVFPLPLLHQIILPRIRDRDIPNFLGAASISKVNNPVDVVPGLGRKKRETGKGGSMVRRMAVSR
jgi:hypothetical protein